MARGQMSKEDGTKYLDQLSTNLLYGIFDYSSNMRSGDVMKEQYTLTIHQYWLPFLQYLLHMFQQL